MRSGSPNRGVAAALLPAGGARGWQLSLGRPTPAGYLALFLVGAFIMRGAGCTFNDIVDRDYDASVARTAARPIPSGQVSVAEAWMPAILGLADLVVLVQFNLFDDRAGCGLARARGYLSLRQAPDLLAAASCSG